MTEKDPTSPSKSYSYLATTMSLKRCEIFLLKDTISVPNSVFTMP